MRQHTKAESQRRARAAETSEQRVQRQRADREARQRARSIEAPDDRTERQRVDREARHRARSTETPEDRTERQRVDREARQRARSTEAPEDRIERQRVEREARHRTRSVEALEDRTERQRVDREARGRARSAARAELYSQRLARARGQKRCEACADDIEHFDESLYNVAHTLSKVSLFQCPKCSSCGAYCWKEERKGFCCSNGRVDLCYDPENPKPGSIPPQPPQAIRQLFENPSFIQHSRNYNNALSMASIGMKEISPPGSRFNPGVRIQGKVHHFIGPLLPDSDSTAPCFAQLYVYDAENELQNRRTHPSNQNLDPQLLLAAQDVLHDCNPLIQQFKAAVEFVAINDPASEMKIYLSDTAPRNIHPGLYPKP